MARPKEAANNLFVRSLGAHARSLACRFDICLRGGTLEKDSLRAFSCRRHNYTERLVFVTTSAALQRLCTYSAKNVMHALWPKR